MADLALWIAMGCSAIAAALWCWRRPLGRHFPEVSSKDLTPESARLSAEIGGDLLIVGLVSFMVSRSVLLPAIHNLRLNWVDTFLVGKGGLLAIAVALILLSIGLGKRRRKHQLSGEGGEAKAACPSDDLGVVCSPPHRRFGALLIGVWAYLAVLIPIIGLHVLQKQLAANQDEPAIQESLGKFLDLAKGGAWPQLALITLGLVMVVPLFEEVLYRGYFQTGMRGLSAQMSVPRATGRRLSIMFSSVLFTLVHEPFTWLPIFGIAVFLGWLYDRTRCLWTTVAFHALHNALTLGYALLIAAQ